jgi:molybdopterin biosynthesis enzyme
MKTPPAHPKAVARTLAEALADIRARCAPLPPERVPLAEAWGRVLRETLWPARLEWTTNAPGLHPLPWSSSGDITCLAEANALLRIPPATTALAAQTEVEFLPCSTLSLRST